MKTNVGVIFGGRSGEHDISVRSAKSVVEQIDREKYEVFPIAITNVGRWLGPSESIGLLPEATRSFIDGEAAGVTGDVALIGDTGFRGLTVMDSGYGRSSARLDVVFPVLHGTFGEDGTIQGLLEMADIPYVGCGVLASSCGMDKVVMKKLFVDAGLPICRYDWFLRDDWEANKETVIQQLETKLGYPSFIKPANLGSSVGVTAANDRTSLVKAIDLAAQYDQKDNR